MFICPKCKAQLTKNVTSFRCLNGHSYDISSSGYVNLLLGSKIGNHGDNKEMIVARRAFLSLGHYLPIIETVASIICDNIQSGAGTVKILDTGCGEGYYTSGIIKALGNQGLNAEIIGLDVSKDAIAYASKRYKDIVFCVASNNSLPFPDASFDVVLSLFAPLNEGEFSRTLKPGGVLITVSPSEDHLFGLKKQIYETPYKNPPSTFEPQILSKTTESTREWTMTLSCNEDIKNLFMMTPYYHKTSPKDKEKALGLTKLSTVIGFNYAVYKKRCVSVNNP